MKPFIINKKGFTLVELLLAITFLVFALTIAYNLYTFSNRSFDSTQIHVNIQREMRMASSYISNELRTAYNVELSESPDKNDYYDKNYHCLFLKNGSLIHRYKNPDTNKTVNKTVLDGDLDSVNYNIMFKKALNEEGNTRDHALAFLITVDRLDYEINSSVIAHNLLKEQGIEDPFNLLRSSCVYYTKLRNEEVTEEPSPGRKRCFIATAAYGSYEEPAVIVLREFRDVYLLTTPLGRSFVEIYYKYSPPLANIVSKSSFFRMLTRIVLMPFIILAYLLIRLRGYVPLIVFQVSIVIYFLWLRRFYKNKMSIKG